MSRRRLNDLLGMRVRYADGRDGDQVTDVRLEPGERLRGALCELVVTGFVIGKRRPGSFLGYDRHPRMGPAIIRWIVLALHRGTGYLPWDDVDRLDWEHRILHLRVNELREMPGPRLSLPAATRRGP